MAKLIYSMLTSLDGYTQDARGGFGWAEPDEEVHAYANHLASTQGMALYGRRMYETMVWWETQGDGPDDPEVMAAWARQWRRTDKIVYSRTLDAPRSARTRVEREFDADAVRRLKAEADRDLSISGPTLAAHALRAGLVDEIEPIVCPVVVGGGTRFLPDDVRLDLALVEARTFASGFVALRYTVASAPNPSPR